MGQRQNKHTAYLSGPNKWKDYNGIPRAAAVFMAGCPGAGKTEVARSLMTGFSPEPVRIDADDIRRYIPGYTGRNAHIFQESATMAVQKILDRIYKQSSTSAPVPFILDGTFSYVRTRDNIKRALKHGYVVDIYYVAQRPELAWRFTKARASTDGRVVPAAVFVNTLQQSRLNVLDVKKTYGLAVSVSFIPKTTMRRIARSMLM